jgi:hypothetical protein
MLPPLNRPKARAQTSRAPATTSAEQRPQTRRQPKAIATLKTQAHPKRPPSVPTLQPPFNPVNHPKSTPHQTPLHPQPTHAEDPSPAKPIFHDQLTRLEMITMTVPADDVGWWDADSAAGRPSRDTRARNLAAETGNTGVFALKNEPRDPQIPTKTRFGDRETQTQRRTAPRHRKAPALDDCDSCADRQQAIKSTATSNRPLPHDRTALLCSQPPRLPSSTQYRQPARSRGRVVASRLPSQNNGTRRWLSLDRDAAASEAKHLVGVGAGGPILRRRSAGPMYKVARPKAIARRRLA